MKSFLSSVRAVVSMIWFAGATLLLSVFILVSYGIGFVMPKSIRAHITKMLSKSPYYWASLNKPMLNTLGAKHWAVNFPKNLDPNGIYLVIANHQSWADILVLTSILDKRAAPLKFFMKKELQWQLPVIGIACKAIGFPMLSRHAKEAIKKNPSLKNKDKQSTIEACEYVKQHPASLIIFPEGTRFTKQKQAKQDHAYKHLLRPKAGGVAMTINGVDEALKGVLDLTVEFDPKGSTVSFWKFAAGEYKSLNVQAELLPIDESLKGDYEVDKEYRKKIQAWLGERWALKDQALFKGGVSE
jgi:1-acyl-sn-glycerol-3-phosphate acyltransferase